MIELLIKWGSLIQKNSTLCNIAKIVVKIQIVMVTVHVRSGIRTTITVTSKDKEVANTNLKAICLHLLEFIFKHDLISFLDLNEIQIP